MALLENSQHSHRRLAFRALLDQLRVNPATVGTRVQPEEAWRVLAEAERRDADVVADILMYPTVGVWLTRALHHTRAGRGTPWAELGYLHLIAASAAIRCGYQCTIRVPVWRGFVSLPTVGHLRLPGAFPSGSVDVACAGAGSRAHVNRAVTIPLDGTDPAFTPTRRHVNTSRGVTMCVWVEDRDAYHGFGDPVPPVVLTDAESSEWHKLLDEAWDVLTLDHPRHARELAAGLRMVVPIEPDSDTIGASSPAAFGGVRMSANASATEFAEALMHELQHSKLNGLMGLVKLVEDDGGRYLAPWRDDPRPLAGLVHGVYAFTCGVEFWLAQEPTAQVHEARRIAFDIAYRRAQVRRALGTLAASGHLTQPGEALVEAVSARLAVCEQAPVTTMLARTVTTMLDDHQGLWRLRHVRPDGEAVTALATAWRDGAPPPSRAVGSHVVTGDERRLPANRHALLRARAIDPDLYAALARVPAELPGTTPRADAALCGGDHAGAATAYENRLHDDPEDGQAWVGLGLALRAQGRNATALLAHPEVTVAVHRRVRLLTGRAPRPTALSAWLSPSL
ncbi:HEXXH motif domain-containing protein [Actinophytocola oryzae]|uniref:HEXXH motif-containing protein n=1 Tax=Actinophytocola oryzae TaxID=502181 RepID=A0A4R7VUT4_9PSEU|nr:HEXXH motif domain-containing protein [Actinophytocola oryzae]TDV53602.1 HEXXH motif-containing protein [Actinophytocola oryzae]